MSEPIRIGLAGLGRDGWGMHCEELEDRKELFRIVAACDPIAARRGAAAERFGYRAYANLEELAADPAVELVDITTRSSDHCAHGLLALTAGKLFEVRQAYNSPYLASRWGLLYACKCLTREFLR